MDSIKEYLPYYLGCTFYTPNSEGELNAITLPWVIDMIDDGKKVQLVLRKLSSITLQEAMHVMRLIVHPQRDYPEKDYNLSLNEYGNPSLKIDNDWYTETLIFGAKTGAIWTHNTTDAAYKVPASVYHYLIKQGFWLWDQSAFDNGLIIEKGK